MDLKSRSAGPVLVLELTGRFDAYGAPRVLEWLSSATGSGPANVVVNLAGVNFMDSTALGTLVQVLKRCRERRGDLHLCCLQQPVRIIFELTGLDRAFDIFPDEDAAIKAFAS